MKELILYGNCQLPFIYSNWLQNIEYFKEYTVNTIIFHEIATNISEYIDIFKKADMIIYQPISEKHNLANTENIKTSILQYLTNDCIKICIPSLYIDMWPFYEESSKYVGGHTIDKYRNEPTVNIINLYDNNLYDFELRDRLYKSISYMKNKEELYCNIIVSDFIVTNYKKYPLFTTQNHPNGIVGSYVAHQICLFLNICSSYIDYSNNINKIIHPTKWLYSRYMKKELELEYDIEDNNDYYRYILCRLYKFPELVKYKYIEV
jgi:hypothetical protein